MGKYFESGKFIMADSYLSVIEAVKHSAWSLNRKPVIEWLSAEEYENDKKKLKDLKNYDCFIGAWWIW